MTSRGTAIAVRPAGLLGALAAVAFTAAGCGTTTVTVTAPAPQSTSPPSVAQTSTSLATSTTSASTATASGQPAFVVKGSDSQGDKTEIDGYLGPVTPAAEIPALAQAVETCSDGPPARAMVVQVRMQATLSSSVAADVAFDIGYTNGYGNGVRFAVDAESGSPTCGGNTVDFGNIEPGSSSTVTDWFILEDAITPNHPSGPGRANLWRWNINYPDRLAFNGNFAQNDLTGGPNVLDCGYDQAVLEDLGFIVLGGSHTPVVNLGNGDNNHRCTSVSVP